MTKRCRYCGTYRIEDNGRRRLENEDEFADVCLECEEWLEEEDELFS